MVIMEATIFRVVVFIEFTLEVYASIDFASEAYRSIDFAWAAYGSIDFAWEAFATIVTQKVFFTIDFASIAFAIDFTCLAFAFAIDFTWIEFAFAINFTWIAFAIDFTYEAADIVKHYSITVITVDKKAANTIVASRTEFYSTASLVVSVVEVAGCSNLVMEVVSSTMSFNTTITFQQEN